MAALLLDPEGRGMHKPHSVQPAGAHSSDEEETYVKQKHVEIHFSFYAGLPLSSSLL